MRDPGRAIAHSSIRCLNHLRSALPPWVPLLLCSSQHPYAYILFASWEKCVSNAKLEGFLDTCYNCFHQILHFSPPSSWTYCSKESFLRFPISPSPPNKVRLVIHWEESSPPISQLSSSAPLFLPSPIPSQMLDRVLAPCSCLELEQQ